MPARRLTNYLDSEKIRYTTLKHSPAYTAQEVAESAHIRGHKLAKTVILDIDNNLTMFVLPASYRVDIDSLRRSISALKLEMCSEKQFSDLFPSCELGALPPFGNLYGMEVYIAEALVDVPQITFCSGTHTELIQMEYTDFARLVHPIQIEHGAYPVRHTPPRMHSTGLHFH
ncbi:MAG: YbaK/EbsC family protein [Motiliproteus sp.]|nr:YbaK/EbsC family protein [Motiliproteus sp.]MCW9053035.1 YbaK/EbsC family protein [Motiliproteus sp.]